MAYITATEVDIKRRALKAEFPGWKFSVRRDGHSGIAVNILAAPIDFLDDECTPVGQRDRLSQTREHGHCQVNHYWLDSHWQGEALVQLKKLFEIVNATNYDNSDSQSDYFDVGFYVHISIGDWNKPFQFKPGAPSPALKAA